LSSGLPALAGCGKTPEKVKSLVALKQSDFAAFTFSVAIAC